MVQPSFLAEQAPIRWARRFVENATSEMMLASAWGQTRMAFNVDDKQLAKLSPVAIYNVDVMRLNDQSLNAGDDRMRSSRRCSAGVSTAAAATRRIVPMSPITSGAHCSTWAAKRALRRSLAGRSASTSPSPARRIPCRFKRVEPLNGRPFYLGVNAVSVGQFAAWCWIRPLRGRRPGSCRGPTRKEKAGHAAREPRAPGNGADPQPPRSPSRLVLAHARVTKKRLSARLCRKRKFNRDDAERCRRKAAIRSHWNIRFNTSARETALSLFYAGLCGCRLPTPDEWQAAYIRFEKNVSIDRWNLRDQTWDAHSEKICRVASEKNGGRTRGILPRRDEPVFGRQQRGDLSPR